MNDQDLGQPPAVDAVRQKYGFGLSWLVLMVALPPLVFLSDAAAWLQFWSHVSLPTWQAAGLYEAWFLAQAALQVWAPGPTVQGMELPDGSRPGGFGLAGRHRLV